MQGKAHISILQKTNTIEVDCFNFGLHDKNITSFHRKNELKMMDLFTTILTTALLLLCCKGRTLVQAQENITVDPCVEIPRKGFYLVNPRSNVISPLPDVINLGEYPSQAGFNIHIEDLNNCGPPLWRVVKSMRVKYYFNGTLERTSCVTETPYTVFGATNVSGKVRYRLYPFPNTTTETNATIEAIPYLDEEGCNGTVRGKLGRRSFRFVNSTVKGIKSFETTEELRNAAHRWVLGETNEGSDLAALYGHPIGNWDVSKITNFNSLFSPNFGPTVSFMSFNDDISTWNVSSATSMRAMFSGTVDFNQNISSWDVSSVVDMSHMFRDAYSFDSDLLWDVSKVVSMEGMFAHARSFSSDISKWNVSSVRNMKEMFQGAMSFNSDISGWDVSSVKNMNSMFYAADFFRGNLSAWDVSSVNDTNSMFALASLFDSDLSAWNVSSTRDMSDMFRSAVNFKSDLSQWHVSKVKTMNSMFYGALQFNSDLSGWDVSSVKDISSMFYHAPTFDQNLCEWGSRLLNTTISYGAFKTFELTNCPNEDSSEKTASPPGPLCYTCT